MPKSTVTVKHQLGRDEAINRIKGLLGQAKEQYGDRITDLKENWSDTGGTFSFSAPRETASAVASHAVIICSKLSLDIWPARRASSVVAALLTRSWISGSRASTFLIHSRFVLCSKNARVLSYLSFQSITISPSRSCPLQVIGLNFSGSSGLIH